MQKRARPHCMWERMKGNYPSFVIDQSANIKTGDIEGKAFVLIDDNSTTGRTFVGLRNFLEENGGSVVGYYALTTGKDQSEKMVTTDKTWNKIVSLGIDAVRDFAKEEGVKREISKRGLTERESQILVSQFKRKKTDTRKDSGTNSLWNETGPGMDGRRGRNVPGTETNGEETGRVREKTSREVPLTEDDSQSPKSVNMLDSTRFENDERIEENTATKLSERGVLNESTDSSGMEERGTYQNNDSVWQRSDDSKEVYSSLGSSKKNLRRGENSGYRYIDWGRIFGDIDVYEQTEKEYAYGVLRKISKLKATNTDQNGNTVSDEQREYFKDTVTKNSKGELIPLYHATDGDFTVFETGDFAYHIGDISQAIDMNKKYIKEVYIKLENPVFIEFDAGVWRGSDIADVLLEQGIITKVEYDKLSKLDGFDDNDNNSVANKAIKELLKENHYDGIVYRNDHETRGLSFMVFDSNQIKYTSNKTPTSDTDIRFNLKQSVEETDGVTSQVRYSDKMVVRDGMTDEERYNILVNKCIENVPKANNEKLALLESKLIASIRESYQLKETERKKLFVKIGEQFNVFKNYNNKDIEVSFEFTRNGMRESEQYQKGNYEIFAKLFSCFDEVIDRAIGIEVHNRNNEGYKTDKSLEEMYILISAFEDGEYIVPVKLEIKEFNNKENKLYIAIALESIKKNEVVKSEYADDSITDNSRSFNIRLSQLLKNVNPKDKDFIKYIPKQFFEENESSHSLKGALSDSEIRNAITNNKLHKYVDKGIISTERYNELIEIYGAIPQGEKSSREVQVPKKTSKGKKVSQTVRTILEAKATPDEAVPTIEKMVEDGVFSYDVYTDKQAIEDAKSYIKEYGWDESLDDWFDAVNKGEISKHITAMGWALYNCKWGRACFCTPPTALAER